MSLYIYNKIFPSSIENNLKVIEFKCEVFDFDVCENINNLEHDCNTLIFHHQISQNLSDLNEKIKNIKFFDYSESLNSLPQHLENLYLCFYIENYITNLPTNLKNLYFMPMYNSMINNILKYVTKIPCNCNLFISENDPKSKLKKTINYKKIKL